MCSVAQGEWNSKGTKRMVGIDISSAAIVARLDGNISEKRINVSFWPRIKNVRLIRLPLDKTLRQWETVSTTASALNFMY
jgi:hypothetical protein